MHRPLEVGLNRSHLWRLSSTPCGRPVLACWGSVTSRESSSRKYLQDSEVVQWALQRL